MRTRAWTIRGVALAAAVAAGLMLGAVSAHACSCVRPSVEREIAAGQDVFVARLGAEPVWTADADFAGMGELRYRAAVEAVYQGRVPDQVVVQGDGAMCGLALTGDRRYLIFSGPQDDVWFVSNCSSSTLLDARGGFDERRLAAVEDRLGDPRVYEPPEGWAETESNPQVKADAPAPTPTWPFAALGGVVLLAAGAYVRTMRR